MAIDYSTPILVVDDYRTVARIIKRLLAQAGFANVDEAVDGEEALARMKERKYGLVISDWHMAPLNGLELLQKVKGDEALKDIPFVLVSAEEAPENMATARAAGAVGYVVKPFDASTLKARIESVLRAA
jgi:two-component system chemotaxis response regulator CheY